jgi:hypothetical protein
MKITASSQVKPGKQAAPAHRPGIMLAKSFLHALMPSLVVTVQTVRVDAVQDLHGVTGPLGHLRARSPGVQPPPNMPLTGPRMTARPGVALLNPVMFIGEP